MKRFRGVVIGSCFLLGAAAHAATMSQETRPTTNPQSMQEEDFLAFVGVDNIRESERVLKARGYNPGAVDGVIDEQTRQALRDFQRFNGLPMTGALDWRTTEQLSERGARYKGSLSVVQNLTEWNQYNE